MRPLQKARSQEIIVSTSRSGSIQMTQHESWLENRFSFSKSHIVCQGACRSQTNILSSALCCCIVVRRTLNPLARILNVFSATLVPLDICRYKSLQERERFHEPQLQNERIAHQQEVIYISPAFNQWLRPW